MKNNYFNFFWPIVVTICVCFCFVVVFNIKVYEYKHKEFIKVKDDSVDMLVNNTFVIEPIYNLLNDKVGSGSSYVAPNFKADNLMIVAHPDDETLWGGVHLIEEDYAVICVTCGVVKTRELEFANAMKYSNDEYAMLGHTDLDNGYISDWINEYDDIESELKKIIESKEWNKVITHNPDGEYGHKHHKKVNKIVTNNISDKDKLYYFGKFYKKENISNVDPNSAIKGERYSKKIEMLKSYPSQGLPVGNVNHYQMYPYENWVSYSDWS